MTTAVAVSDISAFNAPNATFTKVPYANVTYDDATEYDAAAHSFKASVAGDYEFCASLTSLPASLTLGFELDLFINGARERAFAGGGNGFQQGCRTVHLAANDTVDVEVYQNSGATVNFATNVYWDWLTVSKVDSHVSLGDASGFSAPSMVFTKVPYSTVLYDVANEYDAANHDFVPVTSGDYQFCASLTAVPASLTLSFELDLYIDGQREKAIAGGGAGFQQGCRTVRLTAGQTVAIEAYQGGGTTVAFANNVYWNWLTIDKVASHASVSDVTAFSAPNMTFTSVPYANALNNTGEFATGTQTFTAATAGDYEFCGSLTSIPASATADYELDLYIDGAREKAFAGGGSGFEQGCRTVRLNQSQKVSIEVYQGTAAALAYAQNVYWNWMTVNKTK